jgi:hypothetical protein
VFNIRRLIALGYLYCDHKDMVTKKEELWAMVNPDMNSRVSKKDIKETLKMFFYYAIQLQLEIEERKEPLKQRKDIIEYLESGGRDIDHMIEEHIMKSLPHYDDLSEDEFVKNINDEYLNPIGIRS